MKRKVIAWTAAVLIAALVSVAFLRPTEYENDPYFGYVEHVYELGRTEPITDCVGDTHLLRAEAVTFRHQATCPTIRFAVAEGREIAFSSHMYGNGDFVDDGGIAERFGYIEKRIGGEWVYYSELLIEPPVMMTTIPPYDITDGVEDFAIDLPIAEAGVYRFTYCFRELLDSDRSTYTTGEQLHTISHTYTIPEPSGKPFDLLLLSINDYVHPGGFKRISFVIRENGDEKLPDTMYAELEILRDGEWVDAPPREGYETALVLSDGGEYRLYDRDGIRIPNPIVAYADDPDTDYRLTLEFVEHEDGSGERYTLQFHMNFSEEE